MEQENQYEKAIRNFFKGDKYVELSSIEIERVNDAEAVVKAKIGKEHLNANGSVQGGMLYTLADFAFALLGNYLHPYTVTQSGQISYLRPAICDELIATARELERAGHTSVSDVVITDDNGKTVCVCRFSGFVKEIDKEEMIKKHGEKQ